MVTIVHTSMLVGPVVRTYAPFERGWLLFVSAGMAVGVGSVRHLRPV